MRAGRFSKPLTILQRATAPDADGAPKETWQSAGTTMGDIRPLRGSEVFEAGKSQARVDTQINCHYRATIKNHMRIQYGARMFEIYQVNNMHERNLELQLLCTELVS